MKKKLTSIIMLIMIFSSFLGVAFITEPTSAEKNTFVRDSFGKIDEPASSEKFSSNKEDKTVENLGRSASNCEDEWNFFNGTNEWSSLAYSDGNKTRLTIGINGENSMGSLEEISAKYEAQILNTVSINGTIRAVVVELTLKSVTTFVEEIHYVGLASYVEPNMKVQAQFAPNDPQWNMQWGPKRIEADWAWNTTVGDPSVLVAVVDTGIYYPHPDIGANYVPLGYDWANMDPDPLDDAGHGTHCAGIIAAVLNNGVGIAGIAQVSIMAEKVLDSMGRGYVDWVANGIIHATDCGADIISLSLGGYGDSKLVHEAVRYAYDSGVLVIAAAGNDNTNVKLYPAGYGEAVAVAATDQYDIKAGFSNWGDWIELSAPGVDIYSTVPGGYEVHSGTSMACPHVSGVAALTWSRFPDKTRDWVRKWLQFTADDRGELGFDEFYGYGRVNARKAVEQTLLAHDLTAYEWSTPPYVKPGGIGIINATILNFGGNDETNISVRLSANDEAIASTVVGFLASGNSATVSFMWNPIIEGLYNVTLYVVPVPGEVNLENNLLWKHIYVKVPVKAVVLHSFGNILDNNIVNWQSLNNEWYLFGATMVYIDYTTLDKEDVTYEDIAATEADVLIISCAYTASMGWEFTDSEIEAITQYVREGHGLIATAGTLSYEAPNNNKLAPLFGLNETTTWTTEITNLLQLLYPMHPIFTGVPNPLTFTYLGTALPFDEAWNSNELVGGTYLALGQYDESSIVVYRGLVYISPWFEVLPPSYYYHLQLLYNAITWSRYQIPEHELVASLESPKCLQPGESVMLNSTVSNMGLQNETDVELYLLINGTICDSATIPELPTGTSYTLDYLWTPMMKGSYNVTVYVAPVPNEDITTNNIATKMVYVRPASGHVVFEESHLPAYTIGKNPANGIAGGYSEFADYLEIYGYTVSTIDPGTVINSSVLAPVKVLVIVAPQRNYSVSELDAIENWVKNEGRLLLISDWADFGIQAGAIAERFNISQRGDCICDSDENVGYPSWPYYSDANLLVHPITAGVSRVEMYAGDGLTNVPEDEIRLILSDSDGTAFWFGNRSPAPSVSVMSALDGGTAGSGRLIIMTDSNVWDSIYDADGDGDVSFYDSDNEVLALNSINWLFSSLLHTFTVFSVPSGVIFTVDGLSHVAPWSGTYDEGTSVSLEMPEIYIIGNARYYWNHWSDGNTSRQRTIIVTSRIILTANFAGPYYQLTVASSPALGVRFTINGVTKTTLYTEWLLEGDYVLEMPKTHNGYVWSHWLEDGDTNRIKFISLRGTTWTAVYVAAPPVGGTTFPIDAPANKLEYHIPWVWLLTTMISIIATAIFVTFEKKKRLILPSISYKSDVNSTLYIQ